MNGRNYDGSTFMRLPPGARGYVATVVLAGGLCLLAAMLRVRLNFENVLLFVTLLIALKLWDVSLVWPLTSLGFVLTTLAAKHIRHEEVTTLRWAGVFLIVAGALLVGYSEKLKSTPPAGPLEINKE